MNREEAKLSLERGQQVYLLHETSKGVFAERVWLSYCRKYVCRTHPENKFGVDSAPEDGIYATVGQWCLEYQNIQIESSIVNDEQMNGIERIRHERARQVSECGWSKKHDQEHNSGELVIAAICYAAAANQSPVFVKTENRQGNRITFEDPWSLLQWDDARPYGPNEPSKEQRIRLFEKAGAFIAAEIDRIL